MKINKDKLLFVLIILLEFIFWIPLSFFSFLKRYKSIKIVDEDSDFSVHTRTNCESNKIYINIHEWGGYKLERSKILKNKKIFTCGLKYQLLRYKNYSGNYAVDLTVTISDINLCENIDEISSQCNRIIAVKNAGFDFSGHNAFFQSIKNKKNSYVILSNSSVNSIQNNFLDDYINYMNSNLDVGILGISLAQSYNQTLIKNNFTPHIQSFFLLTTIDVIKEIIIINKNSFPGNNIEHKLLLIRRGEVRFSQLALDLGYKLAIVRPNGQTYKFGRQSKADNCFGILNKLEIEGRLDMENPNTIYPIN